MPASRHPLGPQREALDLRRCTDERHPAEQFGEQAADGVDVVLGDRHLEQLGEVVDRHPGRHPGRAVVEQLHSRCRTVEFVVDLAYDLLDDVLQCHQTGGAAVLVDDDREVAALGLHLAQQHVGRLAVGHEHGLPHVLGDEVVAMVVASADEPGGDVLEVERALDLVGVAVDDRDAGEARPGEQRHRLPQRLAAIDADHIGARHHHLAGDGVTELEDRVDHLSLFGLDEVGFACQVDEFAQLGLGVERSVAVAAPGRHRVADGHQQVRQRAEQVAHPAHDRRERERETAGMLAAEGARRHTDDHERGDRQHRDGDQQRAPELPTQPVDRQRHHDRGRHLGDDAQEVEHHQCGTRVVGQVGERGRTASAVGHELLDLVSTDPRQRAVDRGEGRSDDDRHEGGDQ